MSIFKFNIQDSNNRISHLNESLNNYFEELDNLITKINVEKNNVDVQNLDAINGNEGNITTATSSMKEDIKSKIESQLVGENSLLISTLLNVEGSYARIFNDYQSPNSEMSMGLMGEVRQHSLNELMAIDGLKQLNDKRKDFNKMKKIYDAMVKAFVGPEFKVKSYAGADYSGSKKQLLDMFERLNTVKTTTSFTEEIGNNFMKSLKGKNLAFLGVDTTLSVVNELRNYSFHGDVDKVTGKLVYLPIKTVAGVLAGAGVTTVVALGSYVINPIYDASVDKFEKDMEKSKKEEAVNKVENNWYENGMSNVKTIPNIKQEVITPIPSKSSFAW